MDFLLRAVSGNSAAGIVTGSTNPRVGAGGQAGVQLVGGGQGLQLTITDGDQGFPFCKMVNRNAVNNYYCGT